SGSDFRTSDLGVEISSGVGPTSLNTLLLTFRGTLDEQGVLLRAVGVSAACSTMLLAWHRPVPRIATAVISVLGAIVVLQRLFPAFLVANALAFSVAHALRASLLRWRMTVASLLVLVGLFIFARHYGWDHPVLVFQTYSVQW